VYDSETLRYIFNPTFEALQPQLKGKPRMPNMYQHGEDCEPAEPSKMKDGKGEKNLQDPGSCRKDCEIPESKDRSKDKV